jgi:hypothetical protein
MLVGIFKRSGNERAPLGFVVLHALDVPHHHVMAQHEAVAGSVTLAGESGPNRTLVRS